MSDWKLRQVVSTVKLGDHSCNVKALCGLVASQLKPVGTTGVKRFVELSFLTDMIL